MLISSKHKIHNEILSEIFYLGLDPTNQSIVNIVAGGCFMDNRFAKITEFLDKVVSHVEA